MLYVGYIWGRVESDFLYKEYVPVQRIRIPVQRMSTCKKNTYLCKEYVHVKGIVPVQRIVLVQRIRTCAKNTYLYKEYVPVQRIRTCKENTYQYKEYVYCTPCTKNTDYRGMRPYNLYIKLFLCSVENTVLQFTRIREWGEQRRDVVPRCWGSLDRQTSVTGIPCILPTKQFSSRCGFLPTYRQFSRRCCLSRKSRTGPHVRGGIQIFEGNNRVYVYMDRDAVMTDWLIIYI